MVAHGADDRSDLALVLVKQQVVFFSVWCLIEVRLALHVGTVDVSGLVGSLEHLAAQVSRPALAAAASNG